jgi:hypothetical protein
MDFYWGVFGVLGFIVSGLLLTQASEAMVPSHGPNVAAYKRHMQGYVIIYSLMMREWRLCARGHMGTAVRFLSALHRMWHVAAEPQRCNLRLYNPRLMAELYVGARGQLRASNHLSSPSTYSACTHWNTPHHPHAVGDWLQGPYVYALYDYYGYTVKDIGRLFIAGFGSSMVFGTVVGSLADKQ